MPDHTVDETSRAKGHNYISVFVDLDNSKVIHVCEGRDSETVTPFKLDYEAHKWSAENVSRPWRFDEGPRAETRVVAKASPRAQMSQTTLEAFT